jgi:hypothetical protein
MAGGASLLRKPFAALDVASAPARSRQREADIAADGNAFHPKTSVRPHDANTSGMAPVHIDPGQTRFDGRIGRDGPIVTRIKVRHAPAALQNLRVAFQSPPHRSTAS